MNKPQKYPPPILAIRKPGWIEVGNSRAFLMDSLGGMYNYREQLAQEIGIEAEAEISQRAGFACAERLIVSGLESGSLPANEDGFRQAVMFFGSAGYGNFDIQEIRFKDGWAKITSVDSIEGWMFHEKGTRHGNTCDYARGFFAGVMHYLREASGDDNYNLDEEDSDQVSCVETSCVAAGDEVCTFMVGLTSDLLSEGLQPASVVHSSIRETLLRLNRQLEHILDHSRKDHLTNLYNRSFFEAALRQRIGFAKRRSDVVSLAVIDVDHFKQVNDTQGHAVGDRVLRQLAYILENQARENDIVARLGGDEFVWLMPATPPEAAANVARRISGYLEAMREEVGVPLTVSVGVAGYPKDANSPAELVDSADNALYVAKESGRNQVVVCGSNPSQRESRASERNASAPANPIEAIVAATRSNGGSREHREESRQTVTTGLRVKSRLRTARSGRGR